ncbi:hypothetical protein [Corynebacterium diphtheriae]|uniref:hypothetical protein n=1 Tax=Corynebacterium diphtheriae TaxID=1717 RepID=UPI000EAF1A90|nr:hypothetical protein [Corynebacterium diphtheriae]RKW97201.1 hypothetical protein D9B51_01165 [Corynebacterium diphtheriae]
MVEAVAVGVGVDLVASATCVGGTAVEFVFGCDEFAVVGGGVDADGGYFLVCLVFNKEFGLLVAGGVGKRVGEYVGGGLARRRGSCSALMESNTSLYALRAIEMSVLSAAPSADADSDPVRWTVIAATSDTKTRERTAIIATMGLLNPAAATFILKTLRYRSC